MSMENRYVPKALSIRVPSQSHQAVIIYDNVIVPKVNMGKGKGTLGLISSSNLGGKLSDP